MRKCIGSSKSGIHNYDVSRDKHNSGYFDTIKLVLQICPCLSIIRLFFSMFQGLLSAGSLMLWQEYIDSLQKLSTGAYIAYYAILLVVLFCIYEITMYFIGTFSVYLDERIKTKCEHMIIRKIGNSCANLPLEYFEIPELYDYISRAKQAKDPICSIFLFTSKSLSIICRTLLLCIHIYTQNSLFIIVFLLAMIPPIVGRKISGKALFSLEYDNSTKRRRQDYYKECITSSKYFKETRVLGIASYFLQKWQDEQDDIQNEEWKIGKKQLVLSFITLFLKYALYACSYALSGYELLNGRITIGMFVLVTGVMMTTQPAFNELIVGLSAIISDILKAACFFQLLTINTKERLTENHNHQIQNITLSNITYKYPTATEPVLYNINLSIRKGEKVAIVGINGSGKTTLMKVLLGLFCPSSGNVLYNGINIWEDNNSCTRRASSVFQNYCRYCLTIRENVALGDIKKLKNSYEINSVLVNAGFDIHSSKFEKHGLDTMLGREFGGTDLSGGEWQKLAIARGFLKDHELIVLDEPTASLDPMAEIEILKRYMILTEDKTTIIVSHRLGCVKHVDRILVMQDGRIVEEGSHIELMDKKSVYYTMYNAQSKWYKER